MKRQNICSAWLSLGLLMLLASVACAGDFRIVPGQRIGTVRLRMSRTAVHALLHAPNTIRHLPHHVILDTWLSHRPLPKSAAVQGNYLKYNYVSVFFQHGQAVQIEVSAPNFATANGLSTRHSGSDFARRYLNYKTPYKQRNGNPYVWGNPDPSASSPAAKHFLGYGDAVRQGISWKYDAWGDMSPDTDPEGALATVIIHVPGQMVLLNPNDGLTFSGTGPARK